ncbi:hypothetical protein BC830DRAFT_1105664 [Chytriomyces sp. MP71]|nr:hypothetical protein BC830DRAFT_1105664 [Chytriomyces sp. MP71]
MSVQAAAECAVLYSLSPLNPKDGTTCCGKNGIVCMGDHITAITGSGVQYYVTGSLPDNLGDLTELTELKLGFQTISGTIPTSIGNLKKLSVLDLGANPIRGPIPDSIANCTSLNNLSLGGIRLNGPLPNVLPPLLTVVDFKTSGATGVIPDYSASTGLISIILDGNSIEGPLPSYFGSLNLIQLGLSSNKLTGSIPSSFVNLPSFTILHLDGNFLTGTVPDGLKGLKELHVDVNCLDGQTGELRNPNCPTPVASGPSTGLIVGIVVAAVALLGVIGALVYWRRRRASVESMSRLEPCIKDETIVQVIDGEDAIEARSALSHSSSVEILSLTVAGEVGAKPPRKMPFLDIHLSTAGSASSVQVGKPELMTAEEMGRQRSRLEAVDPHTWTVDQTAVWCTTVLPGGDNVDALIHSKYFLSCTLA